MNESSPECRLQELCKDILAYQKQVEKTADGGNDGGDVYDTEAMWKELIDNATGILEGTR